MTTIASEFDLELVEVNLSEIINLFAVGIGCGIIFATLIFVISLVINIFFDIVKKG